MSKEMWYAAVVGALFGGILSVPLQLATGLVFPNVQRWFDARIKARAFAKSKRMRKEYEEALYFVTYPHKMTHYFLNRSIEVLRLGIFLFIGMLSLIYGPFKTQPGVWSTITLLTAIGVYLFLILVISQSVNQLHAIYYRVEFWGEYKKQVLVELPDVESS